MNIIEALKTGRRFKRKHGADFFNPKHSYYFTPEDVLADDWEVMPDKVKKSEIQDAILDMQNTQSISSLKKLLDRILEHGIEE